MTKNNDAAYQNWLEEIKQHRKRFPPRRLSPMDETELIKKLHRTGVTLDEHYVATLIKHDGRIILVEIPWAVADRYTMSDLTKHCAFLLARMPSYATRLRLEVESDGTFRIIEQAEPDAS